MTKKMRTCFWRVSREPYFVLLLGMFPAIPGQASELGLGWDWTLSAESLTDRESHYFETQQDVESVSALLDVEVRYQNWTGLFALKTEDFYNSTNDNHDTELVIQELFTQGETTIFDYALDYQLGKLRLDWGVGYGYRPLDIFKPYRRNPLGIQVEEGAGIASLSYFDTQGEWTWLYTDSSWSSQSGTELGENLEQQGVGLRRYWMSGDSEYQWLAYYDDVRYGIVGASFISVLNESWEVHGSAVVQNKYLGYSIPTDVLDTVELTIGENAKQGLIGVTWANDTGDQIIVEYWYDSRSWSQSDWKIANQRVDSLASDVNYYGLRYAYANGFNHANVVEHNIMLHWSLDGTSAASVGQGYQWLDNVSLTFDIIYSPADSGIIATQWLSYLLHDSGESSLEAEVVARMYTGDKDSAYANLSDEYTIMFNLKGRF